MVDEHWITDGGAARRRRKQDACTGRDSGEREPPEAIRLHAKIRPLDTDFGVAHDFTVPNDPAV